MVRGAWYAVLQSDELRDAPAKVTVHGEDIVLLRCADKIPHAFSANCPHRGCDLSRGTVKNNELICPFHGWHFNAAGSCTHIPANRSEKPISRSARLSVYPACERSGLVWVFTRPEAANPIAPELELFPELQLSGWRRVLFQARWEADFCRVAESVLDVSHLPFVHPDTTGQNIDPVVENLEYSVHPDSIVIHPTPFVPSHPMEAVPAPPGIGERTEIELKFPNRWIIRTPMGNGDWMCTFLTFSPIRRGATQIFGCIMRNFHLDSTFLDEFHLEHTHYIMNQDKEIIECLRPVEAPPLCREAHVPSDAPAIRYRSMLFHAARDDGIPTASAPQGQGGNETLCQ